MRSATPPPGSLADPRPEWAALPPGDLLSRVRGDQNARWSIGCPLPAERYLEAFPLLAADPVRALVLIFGEILLRKQRGEAPRQEEYQQRFPAFADRLALQFQFESALD